MTAGFCADCEATGSKASEPATLSVLEKLIKPSLDINISSAIVAPMQFEALKVFCDVARFRSFSQAATANQLSQSAASQVVLTLERRMGVQLVDRTTRPL